MIMLRLKCVTVWGPLRSGYLDVLREKYAIRQLREYASLPDRIGSRFSELPKP